MANGIQKIYAEIPRTYELVNHVLTLGLDIYCRRKAARMAARDGGEDWLDICSGTGEMAVSLKNHSRNHTRITAADFSLPMIQVAAAKPQSRGIKFVITDAGKLPFRDGQFDLITISFATRNLNKDRESLTQFLGEFCRVLKPGGIFINLETSQPPRTLFRKIMHGYVELAVRPVGRIISGSRYGYNYLAHTIPRFHDADTFAGIIKEAGFNRVDIFPQFFGAIAIHKAVK